MLLQNTEVIRNKITYMQILFFTGAQTPQGSITLTVGKDLRMKNMMLGWFQFQHRNGTSDSWTIDDVNITLSLGSTSGGNAGGTAGTGNTDSGSSSTPTWIYGAIAGGVIIVIAAFVIIAIVIIIRIRLRREKYEFDSPTKSVMQTEFQNPLYGEMETHGVTNENYDDK